MSVEFEAQLRKAFPEETDATVIRLVREAVGLADDLRRSTPFLSTDLGVDLVGTLHRTAALWRIHKACRDGDLPFNAEIVENKTGSSHLLQVKSGLFEAHVVRTDSPGGYPRDAPIRQDARLRNQPDLFDGPRLEPAAHLISKVPKLYAWLSFNTAAKGELSHLCWCMPEELERKYLARVNILRRAFEMGLADKLDLTSEPPKPDPKSALKFKEHIQEQIEQIGGKQIKKDAG